jgi:hypothetical protein
VVSSLAPEHVINLLTLVPDQATGGSALTDQTPPLKLYFMRRLPLIDFTLPSIFNIMISFTRRHTGLMMCLIHIDVSATRVDSWMSVTSLCTFL